MKKLVVAALFVIAACGGKVVVDEPSAASGGSGTGGSPITGSYCLTEPDPTTLSYCGAPTAPVGSCIQNDFCDDQGNVWSAVCSTQICACLLNGESFCDCALTSAGDFCTSTPTCCPYPKI